MHATGRKSSSKALSPSCSRLHVTKAEHPWLVCLHSSPPGSASPCWLHSVAIHTFMHQVETRTQTLRALVLAHVGLSLSFLCSQLGAGFPIRFPKLAPWLSASHSVFQVAIHSVLEKLFRSIWSLPNSRAPFAIKYFFDFLDAQAENKKITDPDVVHIWKTNRWECRWWLTVSQNLGRNLKYTVTVSESQGLASSLEDKITQFCYLQCMEKIYLEC